MIKKKLPLGLLIVSCSLNAMQPEGWDGSCEQCTLIGTCITLSPLLGIYSVARGLPPSRGLFGPHEPSPCTEMWCASIPGLAAHGLMYKSRGFKHHSYTYILLKKMYRHCIEAKNKDS